MANAFRTLLGVSISLFGTLMAIAPPTKAAPSKHGLSNIEATLNRCTLLIAVLPAGATQNQVRAVLPAGCKLSTPHYQATESGFGNYVFVAGSVKGEFVFLPKGYFAQHGRFSPSSQVVLPFHASDQLDTATLTLNDHPDMTRSSGERTILQISRILGKPKLREHLKNMAGEDIETGWTATWRLSGGRTVTYYQNLGGDYGTVLRLLLRNSANV